jgi:hypothetical protein
MKKFNVGDSFTIVHCDGYIAHETVCKVEWFGGKYYYVCESCACYSDDNF